MPARDAGKLQKIKRLQKDPCFSVTLVSRWFTGLWGNRWQSGDGSYGHYFVSFLI